MKEPRQVSNVVKSDNEKAALALARRKQRDAERKRKLYSNETEEERIARKQRDALRHKLKYEEKKLLK